MMDAPEFKQPTSHDPDLIVGDDLSEVSVAHEPIHTTPVEHTSDFIEPTHHEPDLVVGDVLSEVPPPPSLSVPNQPFEAEDVPLPAPHDPSGIIGDDTTELPPPPAISVPPVPFEAEDVPLPGVHVPSNQVGDVPLPPVHVPVDSPGQVSLPGQHVPAGPPTTGPVIIQHEPRSIQQVLDDLRERSEALARFVENAGEDTFSFGLAGPLDAQGARALDPTLTGKYVANYLKSAGAGGLAMFTAIQTALHRMNAKYAKVFNPLYIATLVGPASFSKVALDTDEKIHERVALTVDDPLMVMQAQAERGELTKLSSENSYSPGDRYGEGSVLSVGAMTDVAIDGSTPDPAASAAVARVSAVVDFGNGVKRRTADLSKMFDPRTKGLLPEFKGGAQRRTSRESDVLTNSSFNWPGSRGAVPASFDAFDEIYGYTESGIDDDVAYVPLMFQDLRPTPDGISRKVYFRALNVESSEGFSPNWAEEEAFGRVDPIVGYKSTGRMINLSFLVHAFTPEDLPVIYRKRAWLISMVYPEVADDLTLKAGPIIRLRLGDLYNNSKGGLPGVIKSLDFDDGQQVWELKRGLKAPHGFGVSISFQVLHEGTPAINKGHFTVMKANPPTRSVNDPARLEKIQVEADDSLFSPSKLPRKVK